MDNLFLRILIVSVASTAGLGAGSLIYYALLQDNMIYKGSNHSEWLGQIVGGISIAWFLLVVYVLHLNKLPAILVAALGMAITKLLWDIADGLRYASRLYEAVAVMANDMTQAEQFVKSTHTHRQTQDLRAVAQTIFAPNSRQMRLLDEIITKHHQSIAG